MNKIRRIWTKLIERSNRIRFERALRDIDKTPPLRRGNEPFVQLSMVHHRDVESYLLAAKSFARFLCPKRIVVLMDPSITEADCERIRSHISFIEFLRAEDFREPALPQGGCWERLISISGLVETDYVIQLDADTVTLSDLPEVRLAVRNARSFVLGTDEGVEFTSVALAAEAAKGWQTGENDHVQLLAETNLDRLPPERFQRYVRGCAGFSGFAPKTFSREDLRQLTAQMSELLANRWSAWGSEQFASNLMVSNAPDSLVLPHPKYCNPEEEKDQAAFLHFIGYMRFTSDRYAQATQHVVSALARNRDG